MVYAIFGIPLVLAILNDLGSLFCKYIVRLWRKLRAIRESFRKNLHAFRHFLRQRGKKSSDSATSDALLELGGVVVNTAVDQKAHFSGTASCADGESTADSEDEFKQVPVTLALTITFSWIFFCAALFLLWEKDWSYFQAFYFFFVSLSTIGLGDITPTKPRYMVMNFGLVIVGLSLVSMTLSVIQMNIESFLYRVLRMIQEEYEAAVEAGEAVDKNHIISRVLGRQPWFLKKMAPMVMTRTQKQHMDDIVNCASNVLKVSAASQCGDSCFSNKDAKHHSPVSDNKSFKTVASQALSLNNLTPLNMDDGQSDESYDFDQFVPPFLKSHVSTQTETVVVEPQPEVVLDQLIPEILECQPELLQSGPLSPGGLGSIPSVTVQHERQEPHDIFEFPLQEPPVPRGSEVDSLRTPMPPVEKCDAGTQVSILITAVDPPKLYVVENSLRLIDDMVYEHDMTREVKCLMETAVQTDDSYLKLAKRLENLKMNRAKSLAIWVSPVARKPKQSLHEQPHPEDESSAKSPATLAVDYNAHSGNSV